MCKVGCSLESRLHIILHTIISLALLQGCASHSERLQPVRNALDEGRPLEAIALLNHEMGVKTDADLPSDMGSDNALFVLDRASIQQSVARFELDSLSGRDVFQFVKPARFASC